MFKLFFEDSDTLHILLHDYEDLFYLGVYFCSKTKTGYIFGAGFTSGT
jgi:hypothetical protein